MSAPLRGRALAYLEAHNVMTLATTGPEGPWAAAVFYAGDGFTLFFLSAPGTRHARNLAEQAAVAAAIQEDYKDWRAIQGIQLEGSVRPLEGDERAAAIRRYAAKFPIVGEDAPQEVKQALLRVSWYALSPRRLYFIDNTRGLGHRDEVPL